ncbi:MULTISPECIES: transporter substrate-binding domain-containing protein [Legionellaceae]|uniref:Arginine transport system periplasmic binding protein n=1 Tax=Legionella bozemanae TaxID=447 RepID=A0A0W0R9M3_LEGBO|nr:MULTISPECIES: transporter substrate-binding domain-containing protein [Legionellaceae]KTC67717.1 arginine transport system periplasmic binding protein [Legionella bozemanae]MCW8497064.1 transporter substrate-binding domain-containing protein [Fluoribacter dumoffii]STO32906.1 Sulfate starvation-induced protein 7 [Legionella bozemanae]
MTRFLSLLFLLLTLPVKAQPLIIGIVNNDPPFALQASTSHYFGFDIELMSSICQEMNVECQFKPMVFNALFSEINKGNIDLAIAAITITNERQHQFLFSLPYLSSQGSFIIRKNSKIKTIKQLANKTIGITTGAVFRHWINQYLPQAIIKEYPTTEQLLSALNQKHVDSILMDDFSTDYWVSNNPSSFKGIGKPFAIGIGYGIMAKLGSLPRINGVNTAITKIQDNGIFLSLYRKYFHTIPMHD